MSQEEFAESLNVTRQTVSNWETGKNYPDIETLILISDRFSISLDILLKGDEVLIKDIDNKIKKNKVFKVIIFLFLIIFLVVIFLIVLFYRQITDYFYFDDVTDKPGVLISCLYENDLLEYHIIYNKKNSRPSPRGGTYSVVEAEAIRNVTNQIREIEAYGFYDVNDLTEYLKKLYEEAGATCKMVHYQNLDDYVQKSIEIQDEFIDPLES